MPSTAEPMEGSGHALERPKIPDRLRKPSSERALGVIDLVLGTSTQVVATRARSSFPLFGLTSQRRETQKGRLLHHPNVRITPASASLMSVAGAPLAMRAILWRLQPGERGNLLKIAKIFSKLLPVCKGQTVRSKHANPRIA